MYAIVEIQGQQFKVSEGQEIFINRLEAAEGDKVTFDKVLLVAKEGNFLVGTPTIAAKVETTVLKTPKRWLFCTFHSVLRPLLQMLFGSVHLENALVRGINLCVCRIWSCLFRLKCHQENCLNKIESQVQLWTI